VPLSSTDLTPLNPPDFLQANATLAQFVFPESDFQLWVEAHAPGVFRLRCAALAQLQAEKPSARALWRAEQLLARADAVGELAISSAVDGSGWCITQGDVTLEIQRSPLRLRLMRADTVLWQSTEPAIARTDGHDAHWAWGSVLAPDEAIYGLGEPVYGLDEHDKTLWRNPDSMSSDDMGERLLPLAWSPKGWGLYCNSWAEQRHDVGHAHDTDYTLEVCDSVLDVFLFAGEPAEILNQYSALTGRVAQPGLWAMGVWLAQAFEQPLDATLAAVEQLRAAAISVDTVKLAEPAAYGFAADKPVFEWREDVQASLARLPGLRLNLAAPCFPGVLHGTPLFEEWEDRAWLLINDETGAAEVFDGCEASGDKPFGLLDLTHKDVYKLWVERQRQWQDEGLSAPVCDAHFYIENEVTARSGESGAVLRALYPLLARQGLLDAASGHKTPPEGVVVSRDLGAGAPRFVWQSAPTVTNDWAGAAQGLRTVLGVSNSGVVAHLQSLGNAHADTDAMTPELYLRWLAMLVFSTNFSFQSDPKLLPTAFDEKTQSLVRHWLHWRYRLIPYVLGAIEDAVRTGLPVQRSMALAFPADALAHAWETQYLLGPALLVAPVLHPGKETTVYLPQGSAWWDLRTGWRYEGGTTLSLEVGLDSLPVFGREGHMLCLGLPVRHTDEINTARLLDEVWMFGMPEHSPVVMRNKIRVMQMQGSSYIKGLEGLRILQSEGLEVKRRGAEVRISRVR